jgi:O-antigen/teichoic acid export membrane protein
LPLLVAVVAIPPLVNGLGVARFGVLSLAWVFVGYFSLFDFGLGRAMTQLVAERLGRDDESEVPQLVWTALILMLAMGVIGAVLLLVLVPWIGSRVLEVPPELRDESIAALYMLSCSIPLVIVTTGLRGVLEAYQRFDAANVVRIPLGALQYLGPLAVIPYSATLPTTVGVLVVVRFASAVAYAVLCFRLFPALRSFAPVRAEFARRLVSYGGWMTVSNITAPLLLYLGRFLLAALVSAEAVAYFSTPYDVVVNLLIIPGVFVGVLFPAMARGFQKDVPAVRALYRRSLVQLLALMLPIAVVVVLVAKPALAWWINPQFADHGYRVAQLLAIGVFVNSFGHVSQAVIQSFGRPDVTAKLHVAELGAYVPYLWLLVDAYGIDGAAAAWLVRVTISSIVLHVLASMCLRGSIAKKK